MVALAGCLALAGAGACTSTEGPRASSDTTTAPRPAGPAAELTEIVAPGEPFLPSAGGDFPPDAGYGQREYVAQGSATDYRTPVPLSGDGRWTFTPDTTAPYRTRVLVRRPADAKRFSGTVLVEWLNVSGGVDAAPEWSSTFEELTRSGDAWVGVSAQKIGVSGGPVLVSAPGGEGIAGRGLVALDPARYGTLEHPGDGYSFDIFTQVARALRAGGAQLVGASPARVIAMGESQSAIALVTYINGVQPLTRTFDGFFVHSRGSPALPLVAPGEHADLRGSFAAGPALLRTDTGVPIFDLQTEGDVIGVLNSYAVRQDDTDRFRLWEVAGGAHADAHIVGAHAAQFDCGAPINDAPTHVVVKAALHHLKEWAQRGAEPPMAARLDVPAGPSPAVVRTADGIATGGVRTPPVDVPVDVLSGVPAPNPSVLCLLLGSTTPLPAARIAELYPSRAVYQQRYEQATDAAVGAGYALAADRATLLAYAQPSRVEG